LEDKAAGSDYLKPPGPMRIFCDFWREDEGQDLIEYTLLLAFVAFASAALFVLAGGSISGIVSISNSQLAAANSTAR
jgi:Flp pilus assembly pilin Flp